MTEGKSARELARMFGVSNGTISAKVRAEDWDGEKIAYTNALTRRTYEKIADSVAHEQADIKKESILAARMYLRTFIQELNEKTIRPNAKDAALMIQLLIKELTPDNVPANKDASPVIEVQTAGDTELLRRVLERAREHVSPSGGMGPGVLVDPEATRPN